MNRKVWFKAKEYGYGWYPATWQGWLVLMVFIVLVAANAYRINAETHSVSDMLLNFIPQTIVLTCILIFICYKTGEKAAWRWGKKK